MEELIKKSSLYDTVSMIVPGFITLFAVVGIFEPEYLQLTFGKNDYAVPCYICIFAFSYLLGLIIHHISQFLSDWYLKNNLNHIKAVKNEFNTYKKAFKNSQKMSCCKKIKVWWEKIMWCLGFGESKNDFSTTVDEYYGKYYKVVKSSSSVTIMEAQVSFIRSMLIVFLFIIVSLWLHPIKIKCCCCCILNIQPRIIILIFSFSFIILMWLMFRIQNKIYYRIFEDYHYLHGEGKRE